MYRKEAGLVGFFFLCIVCCREVSRNEGMDDTTHGAI